MSQTVWTKTKIKPNKMWGLTWVQTVCKYEQQKTETGKGMISLYVPRGFYMSAHVLLNLFIEMGKSDKM